MKRLRAILVIVAAGCGTTPPAPAPRVVPKPVASISWTTPTVSATPPAPVLTRCQTIEARLDERVRDAFTKATADALAAVREQRDPISKRLALVRAALDKARASNQPDEIAKLTAQAAKLEERRSRAHPSRSDAALMGLDELRRGNRCVEAPDAAWALSLTNVEVVATDLPDWDEPNAWVMHGERVVVRFDGTNETSAAPSALVGTTAKNTTISGRNLLPRDLDGDHASEWYLLVDGPEVVSSFRVITFRDGALRAYAHKPPMEITEIVATKGEVSFNHYDLLGSYTPCNKNVAVDVWGPRLAIDVLPDGSFSMTSPAARERNKSFCQDMPTRIEDPRDVVCAKLLGADSATVMARIRKDNKAVDCSKPIEYDATRTPNELLPFLVTAAKLPVPYAK